APSEASESISATLGALTRPRSLGKFLRSTQAMSRKYMILVLIIGALAALSADWTEFRGPGGLGISAEKDLPTEWTSQKNIIWKTPLPGPGGSSPITLGKRVFLTCYSGYALDPAKPGNMEDLRRHILCLDRGNGKILWSKEFMPVMPEHKYAGE